VAESGRRYDRGRVEISAKPIQEGGIPWVTLLFGFGPALLIIGFYVWMFRRAVQQVTADKS
jgi:cell division protease FtsH